MSLQSQIIPSSRNPDQFRNMVPVQAKPKEVLDKRLTKSDALAEPFKYTRVAAMFEGEVAAKIHASVPKFKRGRFYGDTKTRTPTKAAAIRRKAIIKQVSKWTPTADIIKASVVKEAAVRTDIRALIDQGKIVQRKVESTAYYITAENADIPMPQHFLVTEKSTRAQALMKHFEDWQYVSEVAKRIGYHNDSCKNDISRFCIEGTFERRKVGRFTQYRKVKNDG